MIVKIGRSKKSSVSPYLVGVPDTPKSVSFSEKVSKRFPDSSGWGYAKILYDAAWDTFKPFGGDSSFGEESLLPVPYGCKGKRLHFHRIPPKVNGCESNCQLTR